MVPMEMISQACERRVTSQGKLDFLLDSPQKVTELRNAYDKEVMRTAELTKDLELRRHEYVFVFRIKLTMHVGLKF